MGNTAIKKKNIEPIWWVPGVPLKMGTVNHNLRDTPNESFTCWVLGYIKDVNSFKYHGTLQMTNMIHVDQTKSYFIMTI